MVDWYATIEPRRAAEVSLTPGGLSGDADPLDSPPANGAEESWLGLQARRLRELAVQAAKGLEQAKGAAKARVERALGEIGLAARSGAKIARDLALPGPLQTDLKGIASWAEKLEWASRAAQIAVLALLLWAATEFLGSPKGRAIVGSRFAR